MNCSIEIFGKTLEIDDAFMTDIKLHISMKDIESKMQTEVKHLFQGNIATFMQVAEGHINIIYELMYRECLKFFKTLGIEDIKKDEILNDDLTYNLMHVYANLEFEVTRDISNIKLMNIPEEKKLQKVHEIEKKFFSTVPKKFEAACHADIEELIPQMEELIKDSGIPIREITAVDRSKGVALFNCVKNTENNVEQAYEYAFQIFQTDPAEREYYEYCMVRFPEQLDRLIKLYVRVGFKLSTELLEKAIKNLFKKLPHDNEKQTLIIKRVLLGIQEVVDISANTTVQKVDKILQDFDTQARTFRNIIFDTREIKEQAENDFNTLTEFCKDIEAAKEEICKEKKEWISQQNYVSEIAQIFIKRLDDRINFIWKMEDSGKIQEIFAATNIGEQSLIEQSITRIDSIGRTDDKRRYIDALRGINEENLAQIREYNKWKNSSFLEKYGISITLIVGGCILTSFAGIGMIPFCGGIILLVRDKMKAGKMKRIWNLLTLNGEFVHPQLLQEENKGSFASNSEERQGSRCAVCGKINSSDTKYCIYCGSKFGIQSRDAES